MTALLKNCLLYFVLLIPVTNNAKGFEGSISMVRETFYDTTYYNYYVGDEKIRIEEFTSSHEMSNLYIVDIQKEVIFVLSPTKHLYTKLETSASHQSLPANYTTKKTNNCKIINGQKCYQWRVRNEEKNAEISYWVTQNDFIFFDKLIKVLNKTEKAWEFFYHIPQSQGFFPLESVENNLVRDEKTRISVIDIHRKQIDTILFKIPAGYKLLAM